MHVACLILHGILLVWLPLLIVRAEERLLASGGFVRAAPAPILECVLEVVEQEVRGDSGAARARRRRGRRGLARPNALIPRSLLLKLLSRPWLLQRLNLDE